LTRGRAYDWKRFWCPRGGGITLIGGYLADLTGTISSPRW
jgi:hypothetical protein